MSDVDPTTESADDNAIILSAVRLERRWITRPGTHGVIVHGRTLRELRVSAQRALALRFGAATPPPVKIRPQSPELDALAEARLHYHAAVRAAVQALRAEATSWTDTVQACDIRIAAAQAVLAEQGEQGEAPS